MTYKTKFRETFKSLRLKKSEKYEKKNQNILDNLVDFQTDLMDTIFEKIGKIEECLIDNISDFDLLNSSTRLFKFVEVPGLYFLHNALTPSQQIFWAKKCLEEYSKSQDTNLSNNNSQDAQCNDLQKQAITSNDIRLFSKLRWANLGFSYDQTTRKYRNLNSMLLNECNFPSKLTNLAQQITSACIDSSFHYIPQAGIVNFYNSDSSMGGHIDDAEFCDAPLISISLGCSCIFLIGIEDSEPVAFRLNSGDVLLMSGKSRYAYHGVPSIIKNSQKQVEHATEDYHNKYCQLKSMFCECHNMECIYKYLNKSRININIRQVF